MCLINIILAKHFPAGLIHPEFKVVSTKTKLYLIVQVKCWLKKRLYGWSLNFCCIFTFIAAFTLFIAFFWSLPVFTLSLKQRISRFGIWETGIYDKTIWLVDLMNPLFNSSTKIIGSIFGQTKSLLIFMNKGY